MINNTNNIHRLIFEDKEITLLGTAHVSKESVRLVTDVIVAARENIRHLKCNNEKS